MVGGIKAVFPMEIYGGPGVPPTFFVREKKFKKKKKMNLKK